MTSGDDRPRQRIERVAGSRRVRLTPAPGTAAEPPTESDEGPEEAGRDAASGPNDERMRREKPPHY
jgi:hypothetical protein